MNRQKRWYDYLWVASLLYLILGFFNILFAWLGLLCFAIPLIMAAAGKDKGYCNRYCGPGAAVALLGGNGSCPADSRSPIGSSPNGFDMVF